MKPYHCSTIIIFLSLSLSPCEPAPWHEYTWRSEGNMWESVFLPPVGSRGSESLGLVAGTTTHWAILPAHRALRIVFCSVSEVCCFVDFKWIFLWGRAGPIDKWITGHTWSGSQAGADRLINNWSSSPKNLKHGRLCSHTQVWDSCKVCFSTVIYSCCL